jgi:hypothetical protein
MEQQQMADAAVLREFLLCALPKGARSRVDEMIRAWDYAGRRYERYAETRTIWSDYKRWRDMLWRLISTSGNLAKDIARLDPISRDDLEARVGSEKLETVIGYLDTLAEQAQSICQQIQVAGPSRDLALERWVHDVAAIYEANFRRKASISGSASELRRERGKFNRLLHIAKPAPLPQRALAHPARLTRILKRRPKSAVLSTRRPRKRLEIPN